MLLRLRLKPFAALFFFTHYQKERVNEFFLILVSEILFWPLKIENSYKGIISSAHYITSPGKGGT